MQTHCLKREIQASEKLQNLRAEKRNDQLSLSNALETPNLRQIDPLLSLELSFWKSSKAEADW